MVQNGGDDVTCSYVTKNKEKKKKIYHVFKALFLLFIEIVCFHVFLFSDSEIVFGFGLK